MEVGSAFQIRQKVLIFAHHCAKYRAIFALHINPSQKMHIPPKKWEGPTAYRGTTAPYIRDYSMDALICPINKKPSRPAPTGRDGCQSPGGDGHIAHARQL